MAQAQESSLVRLYQLRNGYCYNSDSLFLYAFAKKFLRSKSRILDIGCGCGILGALCKRDFECELEMIEKNKQSAFLAQINVKDSVVHCGDFLDFWSEAKFDFLISNPPFYRGEIFPSKNEDLNLARNEQFMPIESMLNRAKKILKSKGSLIFCYDSKEIHRVFFALRNTGFNAEVLRFVHPREDLDATLAMIVARIQSKKSLQVLPPLFTHNGRHQMDNTQEVREIYRLCNTYSIKIDAI